MPASRQLLYPLLYEMIWNDQKRTVVWISQAQDIEYHQRLDRLAQTYTVCDQKTKFVCFEDTDHVGELMGQGLRGDPKRAKNCRAVPLDPSPQRLDTMNHGEKRVQAAHP